MRNLLPRRQLLLYAGLGIMGAGGATILQRGAGKISKAPTDNSTTHLIAPISLQSTSLPEFEEISEWLNSAPLTVAGLKGKVILIQFWTFACVNCQRTLPYVVRWHQQYAAQGLKVIGVHTPEFAFEREVNNIEAALKQHQITYPVPIDNQYKTWQAYKNQYWPHLFLADREGKVRYDHIGEGAYDETEQMIRQLLG